MIPLGFNRNTAQGQQALASAAQYIRPRMKFVKPAAGTPEGIVRAELDNHLLSMPPKVFDTPTEGYNAIENLVENGGNAATRMAAKQVVSDMEAGSTVGVDAVNDLLDGTKQIPLYAVNAIDKNQFSALRDLPIDKRDEISQMLGIYNHPGNNLPIEAGLRGVPMPTGLDYPETASQVYKIQGQLARNVVDAVDQLPQYSGHVSRSGSASAGLEDLYQTYKPGTTFESQGIKVATHDLDDGIAARDKELQLKQELLGKPQTPIQFHIESKYGRMSPFGNDVIFQPGTRFEVSDEPWDEIGLNVSLRDLGTPIDRAKEYSQEFDRLSNIGNKPSSLISTANRLGKEANRPRLMPAREPMQAAEALALVDNAVGNSPATTPIAARTIQRSPRAADMPPDPVPVFKSDPRFPSNIVNEVHQDLRRQATATGGVTGNNDAGFNYESRMQAGENIVPTGLNASQAVVIVDDAIAPMQINRHAADIDDNEIVGFSSYGNNINRSVPTQSAYADKMGVIPYEQLKNVGSVGEGSNPRREVTSTPIAKSQTEDEYYDQQFANQAARNPYGMPDVQRNPYADQATVMQDNRGSGRVDNQAGNILNKTLATGAAVGGGLGAMTLINNALGDSSGSSGGGNAIAQSDSPAPTPRAHFVIDKDNNIAQSFIDRGDGQLQPYKTMDVAGARDAWSKAKQAGWSTSFE